MNADFFGWRIAVRVARSAFICVNLRLIQHVFLLAWMLAAVVPAHADAPHAELPLIQLEIDGHKITAEVAATVESRTQGLMHRKHLPEDRGMLFVFPEPAVYSMWMANTEIPLSVAFIDPGGLIINIRDMPPLTHSSFSAGGDALYALETNTGWFARRGIGPGARIRGLEQAPKAPR